MGPPNLHVQSFFVVNRLVFRWPKPYTFIFHGLGEAHGKHTILCCMILPRNRRIGGMDEQIDLMGFKDAAFPAIDSNDTFKNGRLFFFYIFYLMLHDLWKFLKQNKYKLNSSHLTIFSWARCLFALPVNKNAQRSNLHMSFARFEFHVVARNRPWFSP